MDKSQKHTERKKLDLKELIYTVWFHFTEVQEQAKLISGDKSQNNDYIWGQGLLTGNGNKGAFWDDRNVLHLTLSGIQMGVSYM